MKSKVFNSRSEADVFAKKVRGFVEITTDDRLGKSFIVFYKRDPEV